MNIEFDPQDIQPKEMRVNLISRIRSMISSMPGNLSSMYPADVFV